jgi:hypothetical protein
VRPHHDPNGLDTHGNRRKHQSGTHACSLGRVNGRVHIHPLTDQQAGFSNRFNTLDQPCVDQRLAAGTTRPYEQSQMPRITAHMGG